MEYVSAPYVSFVDADDWVETTMLEDMLQAMERTGVDIVIGQAGRDSGRGYIFTFDEFEGQRNKVIEVDSISARKERILYGMGAGIWGKLYSVAFLRGNHIRFLEETAYEDNFFGALLAVYVKTFYVLDRCYYHYFANLDSTVTERNSEKHLERLDVEIKIIEKMWELGMEKEYRKEICVRFLRMYYINSLHLILERFDELPYDVLNGMKAEVLKRFPDYSIAGDVVELGDIEKGFLLTLDTEMTNGLWDNLAGNYRFIVDSYG